MRAIKYAGAINLLKKPGIPDQSICYLQFKFPGRIPEDFTEVNNLVVYNLYAFTFEQLLHETRGAKMMFSCEQAVAVYNPVGRYMLQHVMRSIHGPADHARRSACTQVACNGAVRRNPAVRDSRNNSIYFFEKRDFFHHNSELEK